MTAVPVENGLRVRHGTRARLVLTDGNRTVADEEVDVDLLGAALTRLSFMFNRLSMSGGVEWWDPSTGAPIGRPKWTATVDAADVLTGDALCDCERCAP